MAVFSRCSHRPSASLARRRQSSHSATVLVTGAQISCLHSWRGPTKPVARSPVRQRTKKLIFLSSFASSTNLVTSCSSFEKPMGP